MSQIQYCLNCGVIEDVPASGFKCLCEDREGEKPIKILGRITDEEMAEWQEFKAKGGEWLAFRDILIGRGQVVDTHMGANRTLGEADKTE